MQEKGAGAGQDIALLHSPTDDGKGVRVLRARDGRLEAGEVRPVREGKPLLGGAELVRLQPREAMPWVCDVCVEHRAESSPVRASDGPAQVASDAYRDNWERTFRTTSEADDRSARRSLN